MPAAQVEKLLGVELADGGAVAALHIVGVDLELGPRVDSALSVSSRLRFDCAGLRLLRTGRTTIRPLKTPRAAPAAMRGSTCCVRRAASVIDCGHGRRS